MTTSFFNKMADKNKTNLNPFERVAKFTQNIASQVAKEVIGVVDITSIFKGEAQKEREKGNNNFSDINVAKLQQAYKRDDQDEIARLQNEIHGGDNKDEASPETVQQFKRFKQDEEEFYVRKKQEEEERKRQEAHEEEERKRQEAERKAQSHQAEIPMGKVRKNIFGGGSKKGNMVVPMEYKPNQGKP
jgi:hypothetical protein